MWTFGAKFLRMTYLMAEAEFRPLKLGRYGGTATEKLFT
jgi:hypothetical protein